MLYFDKFLHEIGKGRRYLRLITLFIIKLVVGYHSYNLVSLIGRQYLQYISLYQRRV